MNTSRYTHLRVWKQSALRLKALGKHTNETMIVLLNRLIETEYERLKIPLPPPHQKKDETNGDV